MNENYRLYAAVSLQLRKAAHAVVAAQTALDGLQGALDASLYTVELLLRAECARQEPTPQERQP